MQHAGQRDVIDIVAGPPDEPIVLDPAPAGSQPADLDLIDAHDASPSALSASFGGAWARSFSAAHSTALTMFW